jgi:hypothetical protein
VRNLVTMILPLLFVVLISAQLRAQDVSSHYGRNHRHIWGGDPKRRGDAR